MELKRKQGHVKVAFLSFTILLAALLEGLPWVLWRRFAPPEHPRKSLEERSEDGEGKACNFSIALTILTGSFLLMVRKVELARINEVGQEFI